MLLVVTTCSFFSPEDVASLATVCGKPPAIRRRSKLVFDVPQSRDVYAIADSINNEIGYRATVIDRALVR